MAKKLTPGKKAAQTRKRRATAAKAVRTRKVRGIARRAVQTRKWNRTQNAAKAGLAALAAGDVEAARKQFETILSVNRPETH